MDRQELKLSVGLPKGWIQTTLENTCTILLGLSPPSSTYNTLQNGLPFFQGNADFGRIHPETRIWCTHPKRTVEANTILLSVRAPVGAINISTEKCAIGRGLVGIKPLNGMSVMFFFYLLWHRRKELEQHGTGTTFSAIRGKDIREFTVMLPPLNEQKQIVSKIESIFNQIGALEEALKSARSQLAQFRRVVLKTAFEGRLVHQDSQVLERSEGLPKGWIQTTLENTCTILLGLSPPSSTYNTLQNGLPFFQGNADFGRIHPETRIWCTHPKRTVEANTILLSVRAPVGAINISTEKCAIGRGLVGIKPLNGMSVMFFFYLLWHRRKELEQHGTGTTFSAIRGKDIREFTVMLPPLNEQNQIVSKIDKVFARVDMIETDITKLLSMLSMLRLSVLKRAFEGKLVPQDPRDEPADRLLERVRHV